MILIRSACFLHPCMNIGDLQFVNIYGFLIYRFGSIFWIASALVWSYYSNWSQEFYWVLNLKLIMAQMGHLLYIIVVMYFIRLHLIMDSCNLKFGLFNLLAGGEREKEIDRPAGRSPLHI
jgi:hypothetical protein